MWEPLDAATTVLLLVMFVPDGQDKRDHSEKGERATVAWGLGSPVPGLDDPDRPPPAARIVEATFLSHSRHRHVGAFLDHSSGKTYDPLIGARTSPPEVSRCLGHF